MVHMPYVWVSNGERHGRYGTNPVYLVTTRATESSTLPVELLVGVPSGRGEATFPGRFRLLPCYDPRWIEPGGVVMYV